MRALNRRGQRLNVVKAYPSTYAAALFLASSYCISRNALECRANASLSLQFSRKMAQIAFSESQIDLLSNASTETYFEYRYPGAHQRSARSRSCPEPRKPRWFSPTWK